MKRFRTLILAILAVFMITSCEKEPEILQNYIDLEMLSDWQDFEIIENEEIIFRVTITTESKVDLSWKDFGQMKDDDSYTGDIVVSAYRPDGITSYFEDLDNGMQDDSQMIEIEEGDTQLLIFVKSKEGRTGTFAIRARGIYDDQVTNPKDLDLSTEWTDKNISEGDTKWFKVDCGTVTSLAAEWMEFDRPETGSNYTADIRVSVYSEDLATTYVEDKNHGYGDNARAFTLTHDTSIIYVKVTLNDPPVEGTFAIRVYEN